MNRRGFLLALAALPFAARAARPAPTSTWTPTLTFAGDAGPSYIVGTYYPPSDIRRYGATPDGRDCSAAIEAALRATGSAHFPAGKWTVNRTVQWP